MTTQPVGRMPPIVWDRMSDAQRAAVDDLAAGPRKGIKGSFIALLRSPELMWRLQRVGEFLGFQSSLPALVSEFASLVVSRQWTRQFEWSTHVPLALNAGAARETIDALREGPRLTTMSSDEAVVYEFITELTLNKGVSDSSYHECINRSENKAWWIWSGSSAISH